MKIVIALGLVFAACVLAERCSDVSECKGTLCASNASHVHIQCQDRHCTCVEDPLPCLQASDCAQGKCIDKDGHSTIFHCLDGACICLRV